MEFVWGFLIIIITGAEIGIGIGQALLLFLFLLLLLPQLLLVSTAHAAAVVGGAGFVALMVMMQRPNGRQCVAVLLLTGLLLLLLLPAAAAAAACRCIAHVQALLLAYYVVERANGTRLTAYTHRTLGTLLITLRVATAATVMGVCGCASYWN